MRLSFSAEIRLAEPTQHQFAMRHGIRRNLELNGPDRPWLCDERMDFNAIAGHQTNFSFHTVAAVDDPNFVASVLIQISVADSERFIV